MNGAGGERNGRRIGGECQEVSRSRHSRTRLHTFGRCGLTGAGRGRGPGVGGFSALRWRLEGPGALSSSSRDRFEALLLLRLNLITPAPFRAASHRPQSLTRFHRDADL